MVGVIERRLLINYRADPDAIRRLLPAPLRPRLVNGCAVAGICLIRLGRLRPRHVPATLGLRSENAAHRIAVEWDTPRGPAVGVYIPRRDSGSAANVVIGGRLFPGQHHRARFDVHETGGDLRVAFASSNRTAAVSVHVRTTHDWSSGLFANLEEASEFFRQGAKGYSATTSARCLDGLELQTHAWQVEPVEILTAQSTFFDDVNRFPAGTAALDCAMLMRDAPVTWNPLPPMPVNPGGDCAPQRLASRTGT
ncbi:MAG: DUF2071 domain-containing protein [Micromonosporaceae bacterium]|nr:DUF2071 domain-containing protein [Micromonosporaceae bacterium]